MPPIAKLVQLQVSEGRRDELLVLLEPVRAASAEEPWTERRAVHAPPRVIVADILAAA
jgi:hypothetical protein